MQDIRGANDKVNVLLVDDQPAKLLANEEILRSLGENLIKASSAREALEFLLKNICYTGLPFSRVSSAKTPAGSPSLANQTRMTEKR